MRVLNAGELAGVAGGTCEGLSQSECWDDFGKTLVDEVSYVWNAFTDWYGQTTLAQMSGDLGIWIYETTHGC